MLARGIVAAILFMTVAHQIACQTAPVTSTTTLNATQGIDSNSTFTVAASAGGLPQAVYYQVSWNVSDATSVNVTFHVYVNGTLKKTAQNNNHLSETPIRSTFSVSGLLDPCAGSVSENDAVEVNFVVNTDGISGDATLTTGTVEVPSIQNGTTFDFKCGVETALGLPCVFYYTTEVNVTEGETFYLMGKATGSVAYVALEENGVCPGDNFQTLGATDTTLTGVTNNTKLWIAVNATSSLAMPQLTFTWLSIDVPPNSPNASPETPVASTPIAPETPNTPEQSPVTEAPAVVNGTTPESGPVSTPNGDENNNLPQWALALLIVFGLLIGVLLIVVIVLCVKNRRRAQYNTV